MNLNLLHIFKNKTVNESECRIWDAKTSRDFLSLQAIETELSGTEMSYERPFHTGSQPNRAEL